MSYKIYIDGFVERVRSSVRVRHNIVNCRNMVNSKELVEYEISAREKLIFSKGQIRFAGDFLK